MSASMSLQHIPAWYSKKPEESVRSLRTGVTDGCEMPCECWTPNPCSLEGQSGLAIAEPALQYI